MLRTANPSATSRRTGSVHTRCAAAAVGDGGRPPAIKLRRAIGKMAAPALDLLNAAAWDVQDLISEGAAAARHKQPAYEPPEVLCQSLD